MLCLLWIAWATHQNLVRYCFHSFFLSFVPYRDRRGAARPMWSHWRATKRYRKLGKSCINTEKDSKQTRKQPEKTSQWLAKFTKLAVLETAFLLPGLCLHSQGIPPLCDPSKRSYWTRGQHPTMQYSKQSWGWWKIQYQHIVTRKQTHKHVKTRRSTVIQRQRQE